MQANDAAQRIAQLSSVAASNYASAAMAAYADFAMQGMKMWMRSIEALQPKPEPRSWYRPMNSRVAEQRPSQASDAPFAMAFAAFAWPQAFAIEAARRTGSGSVARTQITAPALPGVTTPFDIWQSWLRMWPLQGSPACWPMAFMLVHAGWPRDVAFPAATANVAMLEAVGTATRYATETYASYHTDSGHAAAHARYARA